MITIYLHAMHAATTPFLFNEADEEFLEWSDEPVERLRYAISERFPVMYPYHRITLTRVDHALEIMEEVTEIHEGDHFFVTLDPALYARIQFITECHIGDVWLVQYAILFTTTPLDRLDTDRDMAALDHYTFYRNVDTLQYESLERDEDDPTIPLYQCHTLPGLFDAILADYPQFMPYHPDNIRHTLTELILCGS